jgi:SSS family solute:Na+ symporter
MQWIDWMILLVAVTVVGWAGFLAQKYVHGVSGFLSGGRVAGRYVLTVAGAEAGLGLVSVVAMFEMQYQSGLAVGFWGSLGTPVALLVTLTGFVVYRYRQTRAMTLAQFFEIRYSRSFRVFSGFLAFAAGLVHYALFPAVAGRFLIYFCGLPNTVTVGGHVIPTFGLVMALCLSLSLAVVLRGGQITAMVTDCIMGLFSYVAYGVLIVAIFSLFTINQMGDAMLARPPGQSFLNPFDIGKLSQFDLLYVIIGIVMSVYNRMSWQANQGFNCAAKSPHEQKMAGVLGAWRAGFTYICITTLLLGAYTYLNHPDFLAGAAVVKAELASQINFESAAMTETIRNQMLVPVTLRHILPVGVIGIFVSLMVLHMLGTDVSMMHSWGSIAIQDIVIPLRGKPLEPKTQMLLLRLSITGVAIFT